MFIEMLGVDEESIDDVIINEFIANFQQEPPVVTNLNTYLAKNENGKRVYHYKQCLRSGITVKTFVFSDFKMTEICDGKKKNCDKTWNRFMKSKLKNIKHGLDAFYSKELNDSIQNENYSQDIF